MNSGIGSSIVPAPSPCAPESALADLLVRLEGLSGPDRETDYTIAAAFYPILNILPRAGGGWRHPEFGLIASPEEFTDSIDAALALVERLDRDALVKLDNGRQGFWAAQVRLSTAVAPTAPLALLRALVAAKIQEVGNE